MWRSAPSEPVAAYIALSIELVYRLAIKLIKIAGIKYSWGSLIRIPVIQNAQYNAVPLTNSNFSKVNQSPSKFNFFFFKIWKNCENIVEISKHSRQYHIQVAQAWFPSEVIFFFFKNVIQLEENRVLLEALCTFYH